jgi:hypothetical protein
MRKFKLFVMAAVVVSEFLIPNQSFAKLVTEWQDALNISGTGGADRTYGYGWKASDGSLFAYYQVERDGVTNIYVQKIDKNGQKLWGGQGRLVGEGSTIVDLAPDNNGGAVALWITGSPNYEVRAKRFDSNGKEDLSWGTDGILIGSNAGYYARYNAAVSDGTGGAIVVWNVGSDIYAQHVGSDGQLQWNNGVPVYVGEGLLYSAWTEANNMVPDGNGGVFIAWDWYDAINGINRVLVQHLDANGSPQLPYGGLIATSETISAIQGDLIPDGTGGVIITVDAGADDTVVAQRVDSMGNLPWGSDGIVVKNVEDSCWGPRRTFIESVGNGEFVVVWDGMEADDVSCDKSNVYAQKIDINSNLKWAIEGVMVSERGGSIGFPMSLPTEQTGSGFHLLVRILPLLDGLAAVI